MHKNYVSNSQKSVRMFKNGFLEACSKIHFSVPLFIFLPVILFFSIKALFFIKIGLVAFLGFFVLGIFFWTLTEYLLHRFVFHYVPKSRFGKKIHFIFHGVHHDYPNDAKRLVMPPSVSIPLAMLIYFLFSSLLPYPVLNAFFPGFVTGYLIYDISHYAIHHCNFKNKYFKQIKQHHMIHHYNNADKGFGVSSSLWDKIFKTDL